MDMTSNKELRAAARQQLKGKWGGPILICFLFSVMVFVGALIGGFISSFMGVFFLIAASDWYVISIIFGRILPEILQLLLITAISAIFIRSIVTYFISFSKGEILGTSTLFDGFSSFGKNFVTYLLVVLFTYLWSLLLIIPGIIKSLSYSMTFYILTDNPNLTAREAITESRKMMNGYKGKLLLLGLSFIGWAILATLSLGIGYLWLIPYMQLTMAHFYQDIKDRNKESFSGVVVEN